VDPSRYRTCLLMLMTDAGSVFVLRLSAVPTVEDIISYGTLAGEKDGTS